LSPFTNVNIFCTPACRTLFSDSCFWLGSLQYTMYHAKFTRKNGLMQEEPNIRRASYIKHLEDGFCFNNPTLKPKTLSSAIPMCAGQLMVRNISACDHSSGSCAPDIIATMYQEHPCPGCGGLCDLRNTITLEMQPNTEIPAIVTIHGLKNAIGSTLGDACVDMDRQRTKVDAMTALENFASSLKKTNMRDEKVADNINAPDFPNRRDQVMVPTGIACREALVLALLPSLDLDSRALARYLSLLAPSLSLWRNT
jgi:hypothetical protein